MKNLIKAIISNAVNLLAKVKVGRYAFDQILNSTMDSKITVIHRETKLTFATPNKLNHFRVGSFSTKEPETLEWIDSIPEGSVFWDIGANVGLYSCYAAKSRKCRVYSFEPSVFNLELLARNIYINGLVSQVVIVPLPLSDTLKSSTLNMTSTDWGGALSTFGEDYGDDGKILDKVFTFSTIGISIDQAVSLLKIPQPSHIKMDVDGLEHLILTGGRSVLEQVAELAIEVNEDFVEQAINVERHCRESGLVFKEKRHSTMFENNARFGKTYNQLWCRPKENER
jgi:FkbM family methyltransferase